MIPIQESYFRGDTSQSLADIHYNLFNVLVFKNNFRFNTIRILFVGVSKLPEIPPNKREIHIVVYTMVVAYQNKYNI